MGLAPKFEQVSICAPQFLTENPALAYLSTHELARRGDTSSSQMWLQASHCRECALQ